MSLDTPNNIFLGPDDEPPNRPPRSSRRRMERLQPLPGPYVRVPIQWLCKPGRRGHVFEPEGRLFLYVLYRSHWGQRGVTLTNAVTEKVGLSRWAGYRALSQLERKGGVRIERRPGCALVVWPVVLAT